MRHASLAVLALTLAGAPLLPAQGPGGVRGFPTDDPVLKAMWAEGMERSQAMSLIQVLSDGERSLYFYSLANFGSNCGFFANRNHQAVFQAALLFLIPLARREFSSNRLPQYALNLMAMSAVALLVFSIFTTGSRVGFVVGLLGTAWAGWQLHRIVDNPVKSKARLSRARFRLAPRIQKLVIPILVALFAITALLTPHSRVLDRLMSSDAEAPIEDMRVGIFKNSLSMIPDNMPFGGGAGTFAEVYKGYEAAEGISYRYVNHAHNDFLELVYELGIPGIVLFLAAIVLIGRWALDSYAEGGSSRQQSVAFTLALLIVLAGSLFDYPARTPIIASFTVLILGRLYEARGVRGRKSNAT